jgi:formylmethanofuran dehydrogenase subunit E
MTEFDDLFERARAFHGHVCPGIVLGTRLAMAGLRELGMRPGNEQKNLVVFMEIDRCGTDAVQAITGCSLGHRSMKYRDYGKFAGTFVDIESGKAVRVAVRESSRSKTDHLERAEMLRVLADLPENEVLTIQPVSVILDPDDLPGFPQHQAVCDACGERVMDHREVEVDGRTLCRGCAHGSYYVLDV